MHWVQCIVEVLLGTRWSVWVDCPQYRDHPMMTVMTGNGAGRQKDSERRWQCSIQISALLPRNKYVLRRNAVDPTSMALPVCLEMTFK